MILQLCDSDVFAGTERHLCDLMQGLSLAGQSVALVCPTPSPVAEFAARIGVPVHAVSKRWPIDPLAVRFLASMLSSGRVGLLHAHNGRTALHAAAAKRLAGRGAFVMTQHFLSPARVDRRGLKGGLSRALHGFTASHLDHVVAISNAVRDAAVARHEVSPDRITVVHNGMTVRPAARPADQVRAGLGVTEGQLMFFCAARLEAEKDVDLLLQAMASQPPAVRCFIAGEGRLRPALESLIADRSLQTRVTLLGFRDDVPDLMAACDVFVLPARAEPFGLVLLEAMAAGKPVIAADAAGPVEIVDTHPASQTGIRFTPGDVASLSAAISTLAADPDLRQRLGNAGRARFQAHFTADRMARSVADIYTRVLGRPPMPQPVAKAPASLPSHTS